MTTESTTPAAPAVPQSYLMWIGKEHYPTIADYVNEAKTAGISKRVANAAVAAKMTAPGTTVYLAHDEGERVECQHCLTSIENPERRKGEQALQAAGVECDNRKRDLASAEAAAVKANEGKDEAAKTAADAAVTRAFRLVGNAVAKLDKLQTAVDAEPKTIEAGSGGSVTLKDGSKWDYRRYMYWRNQPKKWSQENVAEDGLKMCKHCGGFGQLPVGKVFGVFMPDAAEYVLKPEDNDKVREEMRALGLETITATVVAKEAKRGCGLRKAGGTYVVTRVKEGTPEQLTETLNKLVAQGIIKPADAEVNGSFVEFINPVGIEGEKRFRGIKVWEPTPEAADEGEMIADAVAV